MKENRLNEAAAPTADMTVTAAAEMTPKTVAQTVLEIQQKVAQKARSLSIDPDSICIMQSPRLWLPSLSTLPLARESGYWGKTGCRSTCPRRTDTNWRMAARYTLSGRSRPTRSSI